MDKANCSGIEFYVCLRKRVEVSVASFDHVKDDQFMSSKIMIPLTSPPKARTQQMFNYQHLRNKSSLINSEINFIILLMILSILHPASNKLESSGKESIQEYPAWWWNERRVVSVVSLVCIAWYHLTSRCDPDFPIHDDTRASYLMIYIRAGPTWNLLRSWDCWNHIN